MIDGRVDKMYKDTDRQVPLFGVDNKMTDKQREKLSDTWAPVFVEKVFPILLKSESDFADLYDERMGRPAKSIARKLGICLLQHMFDLDDQRALDMLLYDIRWQYALGYRQDEDPYLSRVSVQWGDEVMRRNARKSSGWQLECGQAGRGPQGTEHLRQYI